MNVDEKFLEKSILFHAIKDPYFMGHIIEHVDFAFFSDKDVRTIFKKVIAFHKEYEKYPSLLEIKTVLDTDESKKSFKNVLLSFKDIDTNVDKEVLIQQTEKFFREKKIVNTMLTIGENFKDYSPEEIAEKMTDACNLSIVTDIGHDYFKNLEDHITWLKMDQKRISTGYDFLDKVLKGGFNTNGRAMYLFMGGTNVGKSIVLGNLAANCVRQNLCVPIISLEMSEQLYAQRMSANFADINIDELKDETDLFRKKIENIKKKNPNAELILKEFAPGSLSVGGLDNYLDKLRQKGYNFDIVYLDYITLMKAASSNGLYESGKRLAEGVRALSYKHSVSFVSVLQANRGGVSGKQPLLDNTSESMGIAHTADFIASLWRDDGDEELNEIKMGVIKNRIGKNFDQQAFELDVRYLRLIEKTGNASFTEDAEKGRRHMAEQIDALSRIENL